MAPKLKPEVVLTSPVLRALQTTSFMGFGVPSIVVPDARERMACAEHLCDVPVDPKIAAESKQFKGFRWSLAKRAGGLRKLQHMIQKTDLESEVDIKRRARRLTQYLLTRPERSIALVSHGAFLLRLTRGPYFGNCEVRTYEVTRRKWRLKKIYYAACNAT